MKHHVAGERWRYIKGRGWMLFGRKRMVARPPRRVSVIDPDDYANDKSDVRVGP